LSVLSGRKGKAENENLKMENQKAMAGAWCGGLYDFWWDFLLAGAAEVEDAMVVELVDRGGLGQAALDGEVGADGLADFGLGYLISISLRKTLAWMSHSPASRVAPFCDCMSRWPM
jgi:hypothetical protein